MLDLKKFDDMIDRSCLNTAEKLHILRYLIKYENLDEEQLLKNINELINDLIILNVDYPTISSLIDFRKLMEKK